MKKVLSILVAMILCAALCSSALALPDYMVADSNGITEAIVKDGEKVTINVAISQAATQGNADQIWIWEYLRRTLNVDIQVEQFSDAKEYRSLALSTGDFPDIMINMGLSTAELVTYGQEEQMLLAIDEYIDECMPHLKAIYDEHPDYKEAITAPDGHIYGLGGIADPDDETRNSGLHIYEAWMQELGIEMPKTLDEFMDLMRAMKAAHPEGIPFAGGYDNNNPSLILLTALGFVTSDAKGLSASLLNGQVTFPYADRERYPEFLRLMNEMYETGIMSHDFYTISAAEVRSLVADRKAGLYSSAPWSASADVFMEWNSPMPLTSAYNDTRIWPANMSALTCNRWVINATTKYPEVCCRLADFFFDHELGLVYAFYGPMTSDTDILYDMTSGWYWDDASNWIIYPDIVNDTEGKYGGMENPYRQQKIMLFTGVQLGDYRTFFEDVAAYAHTDYRRVWAMDSLDFRHYATIVENQKPYYIQGYPSNVFFDAETNERVQELKIVINDYVNSETAKFITGARPLTEDELDKFFAQLEAYDYQEYVGYYAEYYAK